MGPGKPNAARFRLIGSMTTTATSARPALEEDLVISRRQPVGLRVARSVLLIVLILVLVALTERLVWWGRILPGVALAAQTISRCGTLT